MLTSSRPTIKMNTLSWPLFKNVEQDIGNLLKEFDKTKSLSFSTFCNVWKESKFSLIFCGRNNIAELREFIEEVFLRAKKFLLPIHEAPIRIGAIYTLYGLYFKQPLKQPVKIRLVKSEWDELRRLTDFCKEQNLYDVVFIHLKLFSSAAYLFTATPRDVGFEYGYRKYFRKENIVASGSSSYSDLANKPIVEPSSIRDLSKLISIYCQLKVDTINKKDPKLVNSNFVETIEQILGYAQKPDKKSNSRNEVEDFDDPDDSDYVEDEPQKKIGRKRRNLKIRAFSGKRKEASSDNQGKVSSLSPKRKRRKITRHTWKTKKTARILLEQRRLDNPGPSTSAVPYEDLSLPQL